MSSDNGIYIIEMMTKGFLIVHAQAIDNLSYNLEECQNTYKSFLENLKRGTPKDWYDFRQHYNDALIRGHDMAGEIMKSAPLEYGVCCLGSIRTILQGMGWIYAYDSEIEQLEYEAKNVYSDRCQKSRSERSTTDQSL